jgi:hypothetical protein
MPITYDTSVYSYAADSVKAADVTLTEHYQHTNSALTTTTAPQSYYTTTLQVSKHPCYTVALTVTVTELAGSTKEGSFLHVGPGGSWRVTSGSIR